MRHLTFIGDDDGQQPNDTAGFILAFSILSSASFISVVQGLYETSRKHYLYDRYSLKILFPWASFVQVLENATLAYDVSGRGEVMDWWRYIVYVLQATVPPALLLSTFDVTYSIHKTRNIQFCGVYDGHTRSKNPLRAMLLKVSMRTLALAMLGVGIVTNFNLWVTPNPLAGRVGWYYFVSTNYEDWDENSLHILLGISPAGIVGLAGIYFSIALWRYGSVYSIVVHASPLNPWFSPFFGTLALVGGQWASEKWFPLLSNLGIFVFVESILLLFMEVNKDMEAATDLREFLTAIGGSGKRTTKDLDVLSDRQNKSPHCGGAETPRNNGDNIMSHIEEEELDEADEDTEEDADVEIGTNVIIPNGERGTDDDDEHKLEFQ